MVDEPWMDKAKRGKEPWMDKTTRGKEPWVKRRGK